MHTEMDNEQVDKILQIRNDIDELTRVAMFLEDLSEEWGLGMPLAFSLNLVLEEALTNVISYGFDDDSEHTIEVRLKKSGALLSVVIVDDGHEYDPTLKADPDITLAAEERPIGGLGIFLIKKIMDTVEYQRKQNKNILILTKKIEQ
jgi:anti-sigma regulatory factor (Ser/Thr protein kinase)